MRRLKFSLRTLRDNRMLHYERDAIIICESGIIIYNAREISPLSSDINYFDKTNFDIFNNKIIENNR